MAIIVKNSLATIGIGIAFFLVGCAIIAFSATITVTADKTQARLAYRAKRLLGSKMGDYAFGDVFRIETRSGWYQDMTGDSRRSDTVNYSQSFLVLKDGTALPLDNRKNVSANSLTFIFSIFSFFGKKSEAALASQLAAFIGVPYQGVGQIPAIGA